MTNEEIKALLRELAEKAEAQGETRSKTVRISFDPKEPDEPSDQEQQRSSGKKEKRKARSGKKAEKSLQTEKPSQAEKPLQAENPSQAEKPLQAKKQGKVRTEREESDNPISWKLPEDDPETDELTSDEESFISVIPQKGSKSDSKTAPKRPATYREGKEDPQAVPEPDEEAEETEAAFGGRSRSRMPVEDPDFESDADFFRDELPGAGTESRLYLLLAGAAGGIAGRVKEMAAAGRERAQEAKAERARVKEAIRREQEEAQAGDADSADADGKAGEADRSVEGEEKAQGVAEAHAGERSSRGGAGGESEEAEKAGESVEDGDSVEAGEEAQGVAEGHAGERSSGGEAEEADKAGGSVEGGESAEAGEKAQGVAEGHAGERSSGGEAGEAVEGGEADKAGESVEGREAAEAGEKAQGVAEGHAGERSSGGEAGEADKAGAHVSDDAEGEGRFFARLRERGIAARELIMIAAGIVLLALIGVMAVRLLGSSVKGRAIEADEGLSVKVTQEPQSWVNAGEVTLSIRANAPIQSISINGAPQEFEGTDRTELTFLADDRNLDLMVVCEEDVLTARTEFEWIDSAAPQLHIRDDGGRITLEAADALSEVAAIYYGEIVGLSNVPAYEVYTQPFTPVEGSVYSCVARDNAGNMSLPVVTDFSAPEEISFAVERVSLFPGENAFLRVRTQPEYAYLGDMTLTNSDGSVIALEGNGSIRALAEGSAKVTASIPGLASAVCEVDVRTEAQLTISTVGDITLGDDENFNSAGSFTETYSMNNDAYFFENVRSIFAADDLTFGNLEGTLTNQGTREIKEYAFRGDPSYTAILQSGSVEAVTLANNHSRDYGDISLTDTEKYLDEAGIAWCNGDHIAYVEAEGVKIGLIGIYVLADGLEREQQVQSTIREARDNGAQLVIVAFHWGNEGASEPDETQKTLAHLAVDCGADLVVGHHPHVLQGIELYNGKYIAYSLANFCFGGNTNPSDKDTMIFQQTFKVTQDGQITPEEIRVIPCSVSSESGRNNYQPTPASGTEQTRIMDRIREMSGALGTQLP